MAAPAVAQRTVAGVKRGRAPAPATRVLHGRATPYLFLLPYLAIFGVFGFLPIVLGVWISLHQWDFQLPDTPFVGADNYKDLFSSGSLVYSDWWQSVLDLREEIGPLPAGTLDVVALIREDRDHGHRF